MALFRRRPPKVDKLRRNGDLEGLRAALTYRDRVFDRRGLPNDLGIGVRLEAVKALAEFYGPVVALALGEALGDEDPDVRACAAEGIRSLRVPAEVDRLVIGVVEWPVPPYGAAAEAALATLAELRTEALVSRMAVVMVDSHAELTPERHGQALDTLVAADPTGPYAACRPAIRHLLAMLRERPEPGTAARVTWVLERVAHWGIDRLVGALSDPELQTAAAHLLGRARATQAVDHLIALLEAHEKADVRRAAASALGEIRATDSVESLLVATRDPEYSVREAAGGALDRLGAAGLILGIAATVREMGRTSLASPAGADKATDEVTADEVTPLEWAGQVVTRLLGCGSAGGER